MTSGTRTTWSELTHAYGTATDIPGLLQKVRTDFRPGHDSDSPWFSLWSALCHQGDVYLASYAALPLLVELAQQPSYICRYDPLWLAANIERGRLEGRGPLLPAHLAEEYMKSLTIALELSAAGAANCSDSDAASAFQMSHAIFSGDLALADSLSEDAY